MSKLLSKHQFYSEYYSVVISTPQRKYATTLLLDYLPTSAIMFRTRGGSSEIYSPSTRRQLEVGNRDLQPPM